MDKPEEPPIADPGEPKASRLTTIVLIVSLVLVVLVAGVLGTVAVLMTQNPDTPLLGGKPPQHLAVPIHFAPVTETKPAPCPGDPAVLDSARTTCYLLEDGITVQSVQRIEPLRERDGQYSVRIAVAPAFKERLMELVDELALDQRQVAIVLAPEQADQPKTVLAAPIVTQPMEGDSISIAGFTKEDAESLVARMLGSSPTGAPTDPASPGPTDPGTQQQTPPGTQQTPPGTNQTQPGQTQTGTGQTQTGTGQTQTGTGQTQTGTGQTQPGAQQTGVSGRVPDKRFPSCKEAVAAGYGPYHKGRHEEYAWYTDLDGNGVACNSADNR
ncbi:excalibur calcium-binding domain-containing protein [Nonomuraea sp. NPDC049419]|uniref:excalibur calcium-binding domain-containing protein n=1 Tax=Nonomuraea sp. NPDC049419 TaxID=3155772 RepID=UPI00341E26AD